MNFFIHQFNRFLFLKKCFCVARFLQSYALYANIRHGFEFLRFSKKGRVQIFLIKREGLVNRGRRVVLKKGILFIFILINPFQCYLSECLMCVCVCVFVCVLFIYTISISIICVSLEERGLIASNQQIWPLQLNNFWTEKVLWKVNFWYQ